MDGWMNEWMNELNWIELNWIELNEWINEWMNHVWMNEYLTVLINYCRNLGVNQLILLLFYLFSLIPILSHQFMAFSLVTDRGFHRCGFHRLRVSPFAGSPTTVCGLIVTCCGFWPCPLIKLRNFLLILVFRIFKVLPGPVEQFRFQISTF